MTDSQAVVRNLEAMEPLRTPVIDAAIGALRLTRASQGLDVGCGIGRQALLLAEAVGAGGQVIGLDYDRRLLQYAQQLVQQAGSGRRVSLYCGDMYALPFADQRFDWVWSMDCAGYPAGDLPRVLAELVRVLRPGGTVALLGWSGQQLLPGHTLLEARLNASCSGYAPFLREQAPAAHFLRAGAALQALGLQAIRAQTLLGEVQAPLKPEQRLALQTLFAMLWGTAQPETTPTDWQAYQRLCTPTSPHYILNLPDYYAYFSYTLFTASRAASRPARGGARLR